MKYVYDILTAIFQFIFGYLTLFIGAWMGLSILLETLGLVGPENTNPWWNTPLTFISFVLTASFGVWIVGLLAAKLRKIDFANRRLWWSTFIGSAIGIIVVAIFYLIQGVVGFWPIRISVIGALAGYYLIPTISK
ncbi:MAG: hypothetical protein ISR58_06315 [Anaerolineales bacterium]|nr:hypothetical protein [Chloroflexota bacterium]MBL6980791.1 hypothetical protein [Anaerolineales bacterium]